MSAARVTVAQRSVHRSTGVGRCCFSQLLSRVPQLQSSPVLRSAGGRHYRVPQMRTDATPRQLHRCGPPAHSEGAGRRRIPQVRATGALRGCGPPARSAGAGRCCVPQEEPIGRPCSAPGVEESGMSAARVIAAQRSAHRSTGVGRCCISHLRAGAASAAAAAGRRCT